MPAKLTTDEVNQYSGTFEIERLKRGFIERGGIDRIDCPKDTLRVFVSYVETNEGEEKGDWRQIEKEHYGFWLGFYDVLEKNENRLVIGNNTLKATLYVP